MVPGISEDRLTYLFIEGLLDATHGIVSALDPSTLQEAILKATRLDTAQTRGKPSSSKTTSKEPSQMKEEHKEPHLSYCDERN